MTTLADGVYVRATEDGFIEVRAVKHQWGVDVGGVLRVERANAAALAAAIAQVHRDEGPPTSVATFPGERVTLRIGGHEMAPVLNLIDRRDDGAESAVALAWSEVPDVVAKITALGDADDGA